MIEDLIACKSVEDIVNIGADLTDSSALFALQRDIVKRNIVFDSATYWEPDKFEMYDANELLDELFCEDGPSRILHTLQLLQICCPAVAVSISKLLNKTTR